MNQTIFICLILFIAQGCSSSIDKDVSISTYNLAEFRQGKLPLSSIIQSLEYIKLETTTKSLLSRGEPKIFGDKVFIKSGSPSSILRFRKRGDFEKRLCRIGKGPGEYVGINAWDVSPNASSIVICDMISRKLCIYDLDGNMVGKLQDDGIIVDVYFQSDDIIIFNKTCQIGVEGYPVLESYNIKTNVRDTLIKSSFLASEVPNGNQFGLNSELHRFNGNLFFSIYNNDTLFRINENQKLNPFLIINCDGLTFDHNNTKTVPIPYGFFQSPEFVFFLINPFSPKLYVVNKNNGDIFHLPKGSHCLKPKAHVLGPINNVDYINDVFYFSSRQSDTWSSLFDIIDLEDMIDKGCINRKDLLTNPNLIKLNNLLKGSSEEDNPILRIIHLKK